MKLDRATDSRPSRGVGRPQALRESRLSPKAEHEKRYARNALQDRIADMRYDEMLRICEASGLDFPKNAKNQGLLTMRARNALYYAVRENIPLVEPGP